MAHQLAENLIIWYKKHMRPLPWRATSDPYMIWLSEIILQQTRVKQGLPYYERFIEKYPDVQALAAAPVDEVLRLWQGLGYYSRARNLHACAQMIVAEYDGKFPEDYKGLQKLKGVGKYTAAAIASFAFQKPVPVVDGNVFRVLSRLFEMEQDIANTKNFQTFFEASASLLPEKESDLYNQAMMELGATTCTPSKPACLVCPIEAFCGAKEKGTQEKYPVKLKKVKVRNRFFYYLVIEYQGQLYLKERGPKDIWQGLFDFPLHESKNSLSEEEIMEQIEDWTHLKKDSFEIEDISAPIKHILTHQRIEARFIHLNIHQEWEAEADHGPLSAYSLEEIESLPKPVLVNNYLSEKFN